MAQRRDVRWGYRGTTELDHGGLATLGFTSLLPTGCHGGLLGLGLEEDRLGGLDRKDGSVKAGVRGCGGEQPGHWHLCKWDIFKGDCDPTRLGSKAPGPASTRGPRFLKQVTRAESTISHRRTEKCPERGRSGSPEMQPATKSQETGAQGHGD